MEFKKGHRGDQAHLSRVAQAAVSQILERRYHLELHDRGIKEILLLGIAFHKKHLEVHKRIGKKGFLTS